MPCETVADEEAVVAIPRVIHRVEVEVQVTLAVVLVEHRRIEVVVDAEERARAMCANAIRITTLFPATCRNQS